jgi:hypothetical protein
MFVQGLPRLFVDFDVVMCSREPGREDTLANIHEELVCARQAIERQGHMGLVAATNARNKGDDVKLTVSSTEAQVTVDVNCFFCGTSTSTVTRKIVPRVQAMILIKGKLASNCRRLL